MNVLQYGDVNTKLEVIVCVCSEVFNSIYFIYMYLVQINWKAADIVACLNYAMHIMLGAGAFIITLQKLLSNCEDISNPTQVTYCIYQYEMSSWQGSGWLVLSKCHGVIDMYYCSPHPLSTAIIHLLKTSGRFKAVSQPSEELS